MYEHRREKLLSRPEFAKRLAAHAVLALLLVSGSMVCGTLGFHLLSRQSWLDALLNAAMFLGGMGVVGDLGPTSGKLFATLFALYSGLVVLLVAGLLFAPLFHRVMHRLHLDLEDEEPPR